MRGSEAAAQRAEAITVAIAVSAPRRTEKRSESPGNASRM